MARVLKCVFVAGFWLASMSYGGGVRQKLGLVNRSKRRDDGNAKTVADFAVKKFKKGALSAPEVQDLVSRDASDVSGVVRQLEESNQHLKKCTQRCNPKTQELI